MQIRSVERMPETSASAYMRVAVIFISKNFMSQQGMNITPVVKYFVKQLKDHTTLLAREVELQLLLKYLGL